MKKKIAPIIFNCIFVLLCLIPVGGMALFGPSQPAANEVLAEAPGLEKKDGSWNESYLSDLSAWVSDRFFLRQELISVNNRLEAALFGVSGAEDVIVGTDGWLYYTPTLGDHTGTARMTPRQLYAAAKNLTLMAQYCREAGKDFVFAITPNKSTLYPEQMPFYGAAADSTNASALLTLLADTQVKTADLFAAFSAREEQLYFAHDSHWNSKGAALGADAINAAFGIHTKYFADDFANTQPHTGDLYEMLYPAFADPEEDPVYGGTLTYEFTGSGTRADSITIETAGGGQGRLLAYRDSFGELLFPYLADSAAQARFSRSVTYDLTLPADRVLIQLVERNLPYLITYPPVMPSPQVQIQLPANTAGTAQCSISTRQTPEGTVKLTGTLPLQPDDRSDIYLLCGGSAYEAFCLDDGGYCAYIPADANPEAVVFTHAETRLAYALAQ